MRDPAIARAVEKRRVVLLGSIFVVAACGLAYELLVGTATSYLRGDTIVHFSLTIGVFMAAMGLGAHLSRSVRGDVLPAFLWIEIALALTGGLSTTVIFTAEAAGGRALAAALSCLVIVGALVGADLPLIARLLVRTGGVRKGLADALSLDYLGGLAAALAFPLLLLPSLGVLRSAILFGLLNLAVVAIGLRVFRHEPLRGRGALRLASAAAAVVLLAAFALSGRWLNVLEARLYGGTIAATLQTRHQRAVLTRDGDDVRLHLNGHLQLASMDEHRYHEALVHPALALAGSPRTVVVIGGGDGLALREVLKHPSVERVILVDYDRELVDWVARRPELVALHGGSLTDPRVTREHRDGFAFLRDATERFDAILVDLPDPGDIGLARLYSTEFYGLCRSRLSEHGTLAVQATSPWHAPRTFWTIVSTIRASGFERAAPARVQVPSFGGDWGFVIASNDPAKDPKDFVVTVPTRWLTPREATAMFEWPADLKVLELPPSRLGDARIATTYAAEWTSW